MHDHLTRGTASTENDALIRIAPFGMVLLWSTGFIGTKLSLPFGEPFTLLMWRFVSTAVVMIGPHRVVRLEC
jgi:drug/metabolite transporter (DMT)-like permease